MSEEDYIGFALHQEQLLERQWLEQSKDCTIRKVERSSLESDFTYGVLYSTEFAEERRWYKSEEKRDKYFNKLMQERDNE